MLHLIARVAAAAGLAAAAYAALPAAPASAAACPTADGVSVVVDFHELGGGVQSACVPGGGGDRASDLFPAAGFALDYVQRQPGFVCRVSGKPADDPCVATPPSDAYWSLWWSDGKSGRWSYSSAGASGLSVPEGGYVAFSWNGSAGNVPPGTTPAAHPTSTPEPTQQPTSKPSQSPTQQPSVSASESPSGSASASEEPSRKPGTKKSKTASPSASASEPAAAESPSPSETEVAVVPASSDPVDPDDGGLPAWVAPVVVVALFGAAGGVAVVRRRRAGAS